MIAERRRTHPVVPPDYEFSIRQRAAIQLLTNAIEHLASAAAALHAPEERQANLDATQILWRCRELVLLAAERYPYQGGAQ